MAAASDGSYGLRVATAAGLLGVPASVYFPESAPEAKTRRIQAAGARLVSIRSTFAEAGERAREDAARTGRRFLHAYDDPDVIAGQGTVAAKVTAGASVVDNLAWRPVAVDLPTARRSRPVTGSP